MMTPIESIYEIRGAVLDLQKYLHSKDAVVSRRAQIRYEQWVDRFFRENDSFLAPQQRYSCLHNLDYFMSLIDSAKEYYETDL
jgi:hypothetical protein